MAGREKLDQDERFLLIFALDQRERLAEHRQLSVGREVSIRKEQERV
jgi:hypothetical protein